MVGHGDAAAEKIVDEAEGEHGGEIQPLHSQHLWLFTVSGNA